MEQNTSETKRSKIKIKVRPVSPLLEEQFSIPGYATEGSAGLDLIACIDAPVVIEPQQVKMIPSGIAVEIPDPGMAGMVYARSGLAYKHSIGLANGVGVIDSDYRGEIGCLLQNNGKKSYTVQPGDRIAQLVFMSVIQAEIILTDELSTTERGSGGFGSTGR